MLASIFVVQGLETVRHPEKVAAAAEPVVRPLANRVPAVPAETEQAVRLNGAVQVAAGSMLGLGILPRLSALALAGTLVPTTLAGHRFWQIEDPQERAQQRIHFLKNLSMLGGLLIAAADSGGAPSLSWRRQRAAKRASALVPSVTQTVAGVTQSVADSARAVGDRVSAATASAADAVTEAASAAGDRLPEFSQAAADSARAAASRVAQAAQSAGEAGQSAAQSAAQSAVEAARSAVEAGRSRASQLTG